MEYRGAILHKLVPHPPHSLDILGMIRISFNLLPQIPHMDVYSPGLTGILITPDQLQELLTGENTVAVACQKIQKLKLLQGKRNGLSSGWDSILSRELLRSRALTLA